MSPHNMILKKYTTIRKRAFKSYIETRLLHFFRLQPAITIPGISSIIHLEVTPDLYNLYAACCQLPSAEKMPGYPHLSIGELDRLYANWYRDFASQLPALQQHFEDHCFLSREKFTEFYNKAGNKCHYCNISEEAISELRELGRIKTKRFITRGKTLEIDRIDSFKPYEEGNLALCCYWCNNAKTDEFSVEEFKKIGKVMERIWQERLKS